MRTAQGNSAYPPEPWRLAGEFVVSAWLVPAQAAPFALPAGYAPLRTGGRLAIGVGFGLYKAAGVLAYNELVAGVLVRRGFSLALTIPWIWVDSTASRAGGRALWAIPKEMARFSVREQPAGLALEARQGGELLAACALTPGAAAPGRWGGGFTIAQPEPGAARLTPAHMDGRLELARSEWRFGGPLAFLNGRRPFLSARLQEAELVFGSERRT